MYALAASNITECCYLTSFSECGITFRDRIEILSELVALIAIQCASFISSFNQ